MSHVYNMLNDSWQNWATEKYQNLVNAYPENRCLVSEHAWDVEMFRDTIARLYEAQMDMSHMK